MSTAITKDLILSPLLPREIAIRATSARAAYAEHVLFRKHLEAASTPVMDRSPRATAIRDRVEVDLEVDALLTQAAEEQRLFNGRLADWTHAAQTAGAR